MIDIDALEKAARAATPGEWRHGSFDRERIYVDMGDPTLLAPTLGRVLVVGNNAFPRMDEDLAYIAMSSPDVVLALIDSVRAAERSRDEAERKIEDMRASWEESQAQLRAANDKLRAVSAGTEDVWFWEGGEHDDADTMACPVVMQPETLRAFVAAKKERDELTEDRVRVMPYTLMEKGGEWLGAARSWLQRKKRNGESVTWSSHDVLEPPMTVLDVEEVAAEAASAAMRKQPSEELLERRLKALWKVEMRLNRAMSLLASAALRLDDIYDYTPERLAVWKEGYLAHAERQECSDGCLWVDSREADTAGRSQVDREAYVCGIEAAHIVDVVRGWETEGVKARKR